MKEIPLTDLRPQDQKLKHEIDKALQQVIEHGKFVDHETVRKFEKAFAELLQIGFCFGLRSGADAIFLALRALEIGPGDEVITAPNASLETASAICRTGAKIHFVDMNPLTLNIDVAKIERAISYNTRVLLPVHLFGQPAELGYLLQLADRHGLSLVEDATQACG
ncbi:MAG: DegT/DnrJ/EryC1/StrS family aminotransferase, partial [bacterium]